MDDYRLYNGFIVPGRDSDAMVYRRTEQAKIAMAALPFWIPEDRRQVCVEAGGNWGLWPLRLAEMFEVVYTFEPDHACFTALANNCRDKPNIVKIQAALGYARELVDLERDADTTGNQFVASMGIYPTFCIDDLALPVCDLIYLDIEGMEYEALLGATATIARCKPIVIFEVTRKYDPKDSVAAYMVRYGYHKWGTIGRDLVMGPHPKTGVKETLAYHWNEDRTALVEVPA